MANELPNSADNLRRLYVGVAGQCYDEIAILRMTRNLAAIATMFGMTVDEMYYKTYGEPLPPYNG